MQTLSHSTRAFIVNADSLRGFLTAFNIIKHLESADKAGQLKDARRWQKIDLDTVQKQLETQPHNKQKMTYLSKHYPSLYVHILGYLNMSDKIEQYMAQCKEYENDEENFSLYVHGYWLIWLNQQRQAGKFTQGKPFTTNH